MKEKYEKCRICGYNVITPVGFDVHISCIHMKAYYKHLELDTKNLILKNHERHRTNKKIHTKTPRNVFSKKQT